jgi:coenzyme F420-reducing hydrogenase alpha subunit
MTTDQPNPFDELTASIASKRAEISNLQEELYNSAKKHLEDAETAIDLFKTVMDETTAKRYRSSLVANLQKMLKKYAAKTTSTPDNAANTRQNAAPISLSDQQQDDFIKEYRKIGH